MDVLLYFLAQTTQMDLSKLRFRSTGSEVLNELVGAAFLLVVIIGAGIGAFFYLRSRRQERELAAQREDTRLRLMVSELNLGHSEVELIQTLAGTNDISELLTLMESRESFEQVVQRFREANPRHPALKRVAPLRRHLEYGFTNVRNPFVDTRMLPAGTRLRCTIRLPKREVSFLTAIVATNESHFIIRPPTAKGKPARLDKLRELNFNVAREHDAEYEFTCPLEGQLTSGIMAVMCTHTRNISRLLFRNADRIEVDIPTEFFVIHQEFATDRPVGALRAIDSQARFDGTLQDISIGGALAFARDAQEVVHEGDMVVFRLAAAVIQDDLVAQCVGVFPRDDGRLQIHLQFLGMKELNRLKLGKYLVGLKKSGASYSQGTKLAQTVNTTP